MKWDNKRLSLTILYEIQIKGQENHRLANRREEKRTNRFTDTRRITPYTSYLLRGFQ